MNKKTLLLISATALALPLSAFAQVTLAGMAAAVAGQVVLVATWIVVIMWVVTGILFLIAQGSPEKAKMARTALLTSVAGTVVLIVASYAVDLVGKSFGI